MPSQIRGLRRKAIRREKVTQEDDPGVVVNIYNSPSTAGNAFVDTAGLTAGTITVATGTRTVGDSRIVTDVETDGLFIGALIPYIAGDTHQLVVGDGIDTDNDSTAIEGASYSGPGVVGRSTNGNGVEGHIGSGGTGHAGRFQQEGDGKGVQSIITNSENDNHASESATNGSGSAYNGVTTGTGSAQYLESQSAAPLNAVLRLSATNAAHDKPLLEGNTAGTGNLLQMQKGGSDKFVVDNNGRVIVGAIDPVALGIIIQDQFTSGSTTSGQIGALGWMQTGGSVSLQAAEADHPGILRMDTGTSSGTTCVLYGRASGGNGAYHSSDLFDSTWIVRLNTNDSNTHVRIGLGYTISNSAPTNNGIYVEKLTSDTSWYGVTRSGGSQTRTAALATCNTSFIKFRIRRIDSSTIGFTVDGGTEVTATANIPSSATDITPCITIYNATAASKTLDVDFFRMILPGVA